MAKKQLPLERNRNPNKNSKSPHKSKTKNSPKINSKNRSKITETANGDASREATELAIVPFSSVESENDEVAESSDAEDDGVERRSSSDEEEEEEEREKTPKSVGKKGKKDDAKSKGKKRSRKGEDESEAEEKTENALYTFPMNRITRMIKREIPDIKISQEAVFLINRASEKFLHVFCKEAYASAFLDKKKHTAYNHLSSVVSKRKRFQFLSDFVPEKVKAQDALAQVEEAEK
ncbi:hypothetical protein C2S51_023642 [Perilla frutescens var. frutescens]|nr:hypothetical protein C2S51_023642 [Perilla frutescens var. frutescens]